MTRLLSLVLTAAEVAGGVMPAQAASQPNARLVQCGAESCLQVSGRRESSEALVALNGHDVAVEGGRSWRVRVPVRTVRHWANAYDRTITVSVAGGTYNAALPVGMLGNGENLAMLIVRAK